jgi:hypothetical protein
MGDMFELEYTDVLADDMTWKVARILERSAEHGTYVQFIGLADTYRQFISSPTRLAPFRTKTRGNSWPETAFESSPKSFYEGELKRFRELQRKLTSQNLTDWLTAKDIITGIRGEFYFAVATIMQDSVGTALLPSALTFLREYASLLVWWLNTASERLPAITEVLLRPESAYDSVDCAKASIWPELFDAFCLICRVNPKTKSNFFKKTEEQSKLLREELEQEGVSSLEELFLADFRKNGGIAALETLLGNL